MIEINIIKTETIKKFFQNDRNNYVLVKSNFKFNHINHFWSIISDYKCSSTNKIYSLTTMIRFNIKIIEKKTIEFYKYDLI